MVVGIGVDSVEIWRIQKALKNTRFCKRCFTSAEMDVLSQRTGERAAGNFAAKEAVAKALGEGFRHMELTEIEVLRNELGKPYVMLHRRAALIAKEKGVFRIEVSISHNLDYAIAFAIAEGGNI